MWRLFSWLAHSGDSWFWVAGLGVIWLISKNGWHYRAAVLIVGIVFQAFFVLLIKFLIRRQRPPGEWGSIYRNTDPHSFPSGHATRAGLLTVMSFGLGPLWFAGLVSLWAPIMSLARVAMGVHYFLDIAAGYGLGLLFGLAMLKIIPILGAFFPFIF